MRSTLSWILGLVALHSILLGIAMLIAPFRLMALIGWEATGTSFFPAQSGLFLLILGVVYAAAIRNRSLLWVVCFSKALAVVFLVAETAAGHCPPLVYFTAALDFAMGAAVAWAWWRERHRLP